MSFNYFREATVYLFTTLFVVLLGCEPQLPAEEQDSAVKETKTDEKSGAIAVDEDEDLKEEGGYHPPPSASMNDDGATVDVNFVAPGALALPLADVGNMDSVDLISVKYLLQSIRICEDDSNQNPSTKCL